MAIAENRMNLEQISEIAVQRYNSVKDSEAIKNLRSLSDKAGKKLEGLGNYVSENIEKVQDLKKNTTNVINEKLGLFENVFCQNIDPLDIRLSNYFSSLNNLLDFKFNTNICNKGMGANPVGSILKAIRSGDGIGSIIPNAKKQLIDNYLKGKINTLIGSVGLPSDVSNCLFGSGSSGFDRFNYGNNGSLRARIDMINMLKGSICGSTDSTRAKMLGKNNTLNTYVVSGLVDKVSRYNYEAGASMLLSVINNPNIDIDREDVINGLVDSINNDKVNILKKLQILEIVSNQAGKDRHKERLYSNIDASLLYKEIYNNPEVLNNLTDEEYAAVIHLLDKLDSSWSINNDYHMLSNDKKYGNYLSSKINDLTPDANTKEVSNVIIDGKLNILDSTLLTNKLTTNETWDPSQEGRIIIGSNAKASDYNSSYIPSNAGIDLERFNVNKPLNVNLFFK